MEVSICEAEQGEVLGEDKDQRSVKYLMNHCVNSRQQEVYFVEEGIIDDFLNCWTNSNQQEDMKPRNSQTNKLCINAGIISDDEVLQRT